MPGQPPVRLDVDPRTEHEGALVGPRVRQGQFGVVAQHRLAGVVPDGDDVDVERTGTEAALRVADPAAGRLQLPDPLQPVPGVGAVRGAPARPR